LGTELKHLNASWDEFFLKVINSEDIKFDDVIAKIHYFDPNMYILAKKKVYIFKNLNNGTWKFETNIMIQNASHLDIRNKCLLFTTPKEVIFLDSKKKNENHSFFQCKDNQFIKILQKYNYFNIISIRYR